MKIFFLNPPYRDQRFSRSQRSPGVIKSGTMYYPYWLAHAAALCESKGHEIWLVDAPADDLSRKDVIERVRDFGPGLIVSETSTPSFNHDLETLQILRDAFPDARLCLVGTHATAEWQKALERCPALDFVAIGEYDFTILDLADALDTPGADLRKIPALGVRGEGGVPQRGPARLPIEDMDSLPWIAPIYKRFLTPENYLFTIASHPMVMLIGGRGCTARCFFCVYPQVMHGHVYRTRSPEHLVGEMKWIQENMPEVNEIVFEDDTFTSDKPRAREIARLVKEKGVRLPFFANIRTNVDYDTLAALKESGLRECATGFESGDDLVLINMRKGQNVAMQRKFMDNCRELGILVHGCFMVGFPGETRETMKKTLDLAIDLDPDSAQFYPVMPYPGTSAFQWAKDQGYLATHDYDEWLTGDGGHRCVMNLPGLTPRQIEEFCETAFREFHFRPAYIARKLVQMVTNPREGKRSVNAGLNFVRYLFTTQREKEKPFEAPEIPVTQEWNAKIKTPFGRMERMETVVRKGLDGRPIQDPAARDAALLQVERESQRL
jgi:anaerobic magnesium-protoporphyrin IX monomethyl ester cyclase